MNHYLAENTLLLGFNENSGYEKLVNEMKYLFESGEIHVLNESEKESRAKKLIKEIDVFLASPEAKKGRTATNIRKVLSFISMGASILAILSFFSTPIAMLVSQKLLTIIAWSGIGGSVGIGLLTLDQIEKAHKLQQRLAKLSKRDKVENKEAIIKLEKALRKVSGAKVKVAPKK
jgi:hypothetical protein